MRQSVLRRAALATLLLLIMPAAQAAEVVAAVAANFAAAMARIEPDFEQASGHQLTVVLGSSGKFLQQIRQGAPFDVLLSADAERPALLEQSGLGVPGSRFTYAIGRLVLWSPQPDAFTDGKAYLKAGAFRHLVIANPVVAPYGAAAQRTLEQLGLWASLQDRIIRAEDIFLVYGKIGLIGFGGINAWARRVLVEEKRWLTDQEYAETLGLGQVLPGPNATNAAIARVYAQYQAANRRAAIEGAQDEEQ